MLGDREVEDLFSFESMINWMLDFGVALTQARSAGDEISEDVCNRPTSCIRKMTPNHGKISLAFARDGVVVPELVRQIRDVLPTDCSREFHKGATSQDLVDTALSIALREFHEIVVARLGKLQASLLVLGNEFGSKHLPFRTRMQTAGRLPVAERIGGWKGAVDDLADDATSMREKICVLQFAGPVGSRHAMTIRNPDRIAKLMAEELGLADTGTSWQTNRSRLVAYASWIGTLTGYLGKVGQDICLMAQSGEVHYSGSGRSSSIPGKQNPVKAEILVALARFNAVLTSGMQHDMVHEQERSGTSWTLEWMVLPQICVAAGTSLRTAIDGLNGITGFGDDKSD